MKSTCQGLHALPTYALFLGWTAFAVWTGASALAFDPSREESATAGFQWQLEAPGYVSIEHVIQEVGLDANHRLALRMEPLVDSGLLSLLMDTIPAEELQDYTEFVDDSEFDPLESLTGLLAYTDNDLEEGEPVDATFFFEVDEAESVTRLIEYLDRSGEEEGDSEDAGEDRDEFMFVCLFEQDSDEIEALAELILALEEKEDPVAFVSAGTSGGLIQSYIDGIATLSLYLWKGGALGLRILNEADDPLEDAQQLIQAMLRRLADAAEAELDPEESRPTMTASGTLEGVEVECRLDVAQSTTLNLVLDLPSETAEEVRPAVLALPFLRDSPEAITAELPEEYADLVEALLDGTEASMDGTEVTLLITLDNETLEELVEGL